MYPDHQTAVDAVNMAIDSRAYEAAKAKQGAMHGQVGACREMTVGEILDRRIVDAERALKSLYDLKGALPGSFLNSSGSRIDGLLSR